MSSTPGPWDISIQPVPPDVAERHIRARAGGRRVFIATVRPLSIDSRGNGDDGDESHESAANARLIAAAPDLLKACELLMVWHQLDPDGAFGTPLMNIVKSTRAAIAKATK